MTEYLTYAEYTERGGTLDSATFSRWIGRASKRIDQETRGRLHDFQPDVLPEEVKQAARDVVEIYAAYGDADEAISSRSNTVGGISESVSFADAGVSGREQKINDAIVDWLLDVQAEPGISILYRGAR